MTVPSRDVESALQHQQEARENRRIWEARPFLRRVYRELHRQIARRIDTRIPGPVVELGSGPGGLREVLPDCILTDAEPHPWLDRVENAYDLSFGDGEVGHLVLFDVLHHLRHPAAAFHELRRVLVPGGRLIVFEPCLSLLGLLVYGPLHREPLGLIRRIEWEAPPGWDPRRDSYYAAQGNAWRIFYHRGAAGYLTGWRIRERRRWSALTYVASGGFRGLRLYPQRAYPLVRGLERICDLLPWLFATRLLVVMEKDQSSQR